MKFKLKNLKKEDFLLNSQKLSCNLKKLLLDLSIPQKMIGCFSPIEREPLWYLKFEENDFIYSLPVLKESFEMSFVKADMSKIQAGKIQQLAGEKVFPSVFLVPGIAFDEKMQRLGRGKGYYDRFLKDKDFLKIAICFEMQILENISIEKHDINMDYIVTENTVIKGKK